MPLPPLNIIELQWVSLNLCWPCLALHPCQSILIHACDGWELKFCAKSINWPAVRLLGVQDNSPMQCNGKYQSFRCNTSAISQSIFYASLQRENNYFTMNSVFTLEQNFVGIFLLVGISRLKTVDLRWKYMQWQTPALCSQCLSSFFYTNFASLWRSSNVL